RGDDLAALELDPDMRRRRALLDVDDPAPQDIARAQLHGDLLDVVACIPSIVRGGVHRQPSLRGYASDPTSRGRPRTQPGASRRRSTCPDCRPSAVRKCTWVSLSAGVKTPRCDSE